MSEREDLRREVFERLRREDRVTPGEWALYAVALTLIGLDAVVWYFG